MQAADSSAIVSALLHPQPDTPAPLEAKRRVRIVFNGQYICDTTKALYVWEHPYWPLFYVPGAELQKKMDVKAVDTIKNGDKEVAEVWQVTSKAGNGKSFRAIYCKEGAWPTIGHDTSLSGLVRVEFREMDAWYEEDTPILVHPKDPTRRIFILPSTRPVAIQLNGITLAQSSSYFHLIESTLPVRYYMPMTAIDPAILRPSKTITKCPYKGDAEYFDVVLNVNGVEQVHKDLIWWYRYTTLECVQIQGMACFYNEKVDVWLDGEQLPGAKSKFV